MTQQTVFPGEAFWAQVWLLLRQRRQMLLKPHREPLRWIVGTKSST